MRATHLVKRISLLASSTTIPAASYVQLLAKASAPTVPINRIEYYNGTGKIILLAFGDAGSEVDEIFVFPGLHFGITCVLPSGARISAKSAFADATTGELGINLWG